jgi:hypothetical protein
MTTGLPQRTSLLVTVSFASLAVVAATLAAAVSLSRPAAARDAGPPAAKPAKTIGYEDTPLQPNGKWRVPEPRVIDPGTASTAKQPGMPPSDAIVLLGGGNDLSKWQMVDGGGPVTWAMKKGVLESGKGYVRTKEEWTDFQLHVEFATPKVIKGEGQGRGNSGIFLLGRFEVQVLDSFENPTYPDGQAAALYGQHPPLVNASRRPGDWQAYDIVFTAPRFKEGKLHRPAVVTVFHNGVVVHHARAFDGPTNHKKIDPYTPDVARGPIALQDHGNPVRFRNVWLRPLPEE